MKKILIAGFQHETNTFAPTEASYNDFVTGGSFPPMVKGNDLLSFKKINVPLGGFLKEFDADDVQFIPVVWAGTSPSAHVTKDAYERIIGEILDAVKVGGFDAIYLDLHGAMATKEVDDCEGDILKRLRAEVGSDLPIVASLDLHANVTADMLKYADILTAYREYPHSDMAETGVRAGKLLKALVAAESKPHFKSKVANFLIPVNAGCTWINPAKSIYEYLEQLEGTYDVSLSFTPGFPLSDFEGCRPCVWGYGESEDSVSKAVELLYEKVAGDEKQWIIEILEPESVVHEAINIAKDASKPVVIADTQDNPGAGGDSDTMGLLKELYKQKAKNAAIGLIWDKQAVNAAHKAGVGAKIKIPLGGKSGAAGDTPFDQEFIVEYIGEGVCTFDGPMLNGMTVNLGHVARLRIDDIEIAVGTVKTQMLDRNLYRICGITPEEKSILVNKSSVHFRADFESMAEKVLIAKAPGPCPVDPADLDWKNLAEGIRLGPNGPVYSKK